MYTIQQRKAIYELALKSLNGDKNTSTIYNIEWCIYRSGICELITQAIYKLRFEKSFEYDFNVEDFPEIKIHMPEELYESIHGFWWPVENREIRKQVLQECIKMTEDENRTE